MIFKVGRSDVRGIAIKYDSDQKPEAATLWLKLNAEKKVELIKLSPRNSGKNLDITIDCQGRLTSIAQPASDFTDSPSPDGEIALAFETISEAAETAAYLAGKE